nr:MAG TPA: hypothetical protein [Caudoviricetes sp.]
MLYRFFLCFFSQLCSFCLLIFLSRFLLNNYILYVLYL